MSELMRMTRRCLENCGWLLPVKRLWTGRRRSEGSALRARGTRKTFGRWCVWLRAGMHALCCVVYSGASGARGPLTEPVPGSL